MKCERRTAVPRVRWPDPPPVKASGDRETAGRTVQEVRRRLNWLGWIAGAVGSIFVFNTIGFLIPIFIGAHERSHLALVNAPVVVAYGLVCGLVLSTRFRRHYDATLEWLVEGRGPNEREHRGPPKLALYGVKLWGPGWVARASLFAGGHAVLPSPGVPARVGAPRWPG